MVAHFKSSCKGCAGPILPGDEIVKTGIGYVHPQCAAVAKRDADEIAAINGGDKQIAAIRQAHHDALIAPVVSADKFAEAAYNQVRAAGWSHYDAAVLRRELERTGAEKGIEAAQAWLDRSIRYH